MLRDNGRVTELETASSLQYIQNRIAPLQATLNNHPLYAAIRTPEHLRLFMQAHVFAVWDFMSLLKALQARLTCVSVPWTPTQWPASRRFVNEIVLGEESDLYRGQAISHFELYLEAMEEFGAETGPIREMLDHPTANGALSVHAFRAPSDAPAEARQFLDTTFAVIRSGSLHAIAAAFTFGREDAIPGIFRSLVRELDARQGGLGKFLWYLERHIQVDGEDHGPLALRMIEDLCGDDERRWDEAALAAEDAIRGRLVLWDGILERIQAV
jgi:pyrroloquinoline quinone (PQQ) biosynthesis protein C